MRPMRRKEKEITKEEAYEIIKNCEYAVLSTINTDENTPYCVPISPVLSDENHIYFHCALEGQKIDNLLKNPHICMACVQNTKLLPELFTTEFESAIITGNAQMVTQEEEKKQALRQICEKYAPVGEDKIEAAISKSLVRTGVCKITIKQICGKAKKIPR